jgi:hypothetical protein
MESEYKCTDCKGDAYIAFVPTTITRGKRKGQQEASWDGLILPNERICLSCARKRGLKFL